MTLEDRDFIMRQVKEMATGIGKLLGKESVKEIIMYDLNQDGELADEEIDSIILVEQLKDLHAEDELENLSKKIGVPVENLEQMYRGERFANKNELIRLENYIDLH